MRQQIIRCTTIEKELALLLKTLSFDNLFVLMDKNTQKFCFPLIELIPEIKLAKKIVIPDGDGSKTITYLLKIWKFLSKKNATRKSILINLGGGMITDIGGFASSTFKRGISFINIPTTLLGAVDAAIGGKTGINANGLKNEIGTFTQAIAVLIDSNFFKTLNNINFLSGFSEMIKHALLDSSEALEEVLCFNINSLDYKKLNSLLFKSILVKEKIVMEDPKEKKNRKALNFGHTFGHAFESLSYKMLKFIPHGYAIAWGMICELYLSFILFGFSEKYLMKIISFVKNHYGEFNFDCSHYRLLHEFMRHDKKNVSGNINFTLLKSVGEIVIDKSIDMKKIDEALDFYKKNY
jgi:3-dehydroquinate synthase